MGTTIKMDKEVEDMKRKLDDHIGLVGEIVIDNKPDVGIIYRSSTGNILFRVTFWFNDPKWYLWGFHSPSIGDMQNVLDGLPY